MNFIRPDLQQNIFYAIYFMILHNFVALIFFAGVVASTLWSLYKPSRQATLLMIGFASLLFGFEYQKHIVEGLKEQTLQSVITMDASAKMERLITVGVSKLIPLGLNLVGWSSLIAAGYLHMKERVRQHGNITTKQQENKRAREQKE